MVGTIVPQFPSQKPSDPSPLITMASILSPSKQGARRASMDDRRKSDQGIMSKFRNMDAENRASSNRRKTIGDVSMKTNATPSTSSNMEQENSRQHPPSKTPSKQGHRVNLGPASSYYFRHHPKTPIEKAISAKKKLDSSGLGLNVSVDKSVVKGGVNDSFDSILADFDDTGAVDNSFISSASESSGGTSSSGSGIDLLNQSTLSDTTELTASNYVKIAASRQRLSDITTASRQQEIFNSGPEMNTREENMEWENDGNERQPMETVDGKNDSNRRNSLPLALSRRASLSGENGSTIVRVQSHSKRRESWQGPAVTVAPLVPKAKASSVSKPAVPKPSNAPRQSVSPSVVRQFALNLTNDRIRQEKEAEEALQRRLSAAGNSSSYRLRQSLGGESTRSKGTSQSMDIDMKGDTGDDVTTTSLPTVPLPFTGQSRASIGEKLSSSIGRIDGSPQGSLTPSIASSARLPELSPIRKELSDAKKTASLNKTLDISTTSTDSSTDVSKGAIDALFDGLLPNDNDEKDVSPPQKLNESTNSAEAQQSTAVSSNDMVGASPASTISTVSKMSRRSSASSKFSLTDMSPRPLPDPDAFQEDHSPPTGDIRLHSSNKKSQSKITPTKLKSPARRVANPKDSPARNTRSAEKRRQRLEALSDIHKSIGKDNYDDKSIKEMSGKDSEMSETQPTSTAKKPEDSPARNTRSAEKRRKQLEVEESALITEANTISLGNKRKTGDVDEDHSVLEDSQSEFLDDNKRQKMSETPLSRFPPSSLKKQPKDGQRPLSEKKSVAFSSPTYMEFNKESPSASLTPAPRQIFAGEDQTVELEADVATMLENVDPMMKEDAGATPYVSRNDKSVPRDMQMSMDVDSESDDDGISPQNGDHTVELEPDIGTILENCEGQLDRQELQSLRDSGKKVNSMVRSMRQEDETVELEMSMQDVLANPDSSSVEEQTVELEQNMEGCLEATELSFMDQSMADDSFSENLSRRRRSSLSSRRFSLAPKGRLSLTSEGRLSVDRSFDVVEQEQNIDQLSEPSKPSPGKEDFNLTAGELLEFSGMFKSSANEDADIISSIGSGAISLSSELISACILSVCEMLEESLEPDVENDGIVSIASDDENVFLSLQKAIRLSDDPLVREDLENVAALLWRSEDKELIQWQVSVGEQLFQTFEGDFQKIREIRSQLDQDLKFIEDRRGVLLSMTTRAARRKSLNRRKVREKFCRSSFSPMRFSYKYSLPFLLFCNLYQR